MRSRADLVAGLGQQVGEATMGVDVIGIEHERRFEVILRRRKLA